VLRKAFGMDYRQRQASGDGERSGTGLFPRQARHWPRAFEAPPSRQPCPRAGITEAGIAPLPGRRKAPCRIPAGRLGLDQSLLVRRGRDQIRL